MVSLSDARLVLCQPFFHRYSGSEVVTLEIAEAFASTGADVTVVTWSSSETMRKETSRIPGCRLIDLKSHESATAIEALGPDLIWSHQGFVPPPLIDLPSRFVFAHLSSFNAFEFPFAPQIERELADRVYFVSDEARDVHLDTGIYTGIADSVFRVLGNPAPRSFHEVAGHNEPASDDLRSLVVVSNHIPDEMVEAIRLLRSSGVSVEVIGAANSRLDTSQKRVTADLISQFDAVMTIGKTVQYSLCAGRPVYCYDYFGGPGWLTEGNIARAKYHNFSGRGFVSLPTQTIVEQLLTGYASARQFVDEHRSEFRNDFSYDRILSDVSEILSRPVDSARFLPRAESLGYIKAHETIGDFGTAYYHSQPEIDRLHTELRLTKNHAANLEAMLRAEQDRDADLERRLAEITETVSWKVTAPLRALRRLVPR